MFCRRIDGWLLAVATLLLVGCGTNNEGSGVTSIHTLRALYRGYPVTVEQNMTIEGVVVSDDRYGEFYQQVVVEDSSGGIIFLVDSDTLYALHKVGDRVRIECRGLTIGDYFGSLRVGMSDMYYEVAPLSLARWCEVCHKVGVADKEPVNEAQIGELSAIHLSTRLGFSPVRFVGAGERWTDNGRDTTRYIIDALSPSDTLAVRLSGRSDFSGEIIPSGECRVVGVLDYHYDHYQLHLASPDDVLPLSEK